MSDHIVTVTRSNPAAARGSSSLDPRVHGGPLRLADLVEGYWAITDAMYDEIQSIYAAHMRGEKIDLKGVEARLGRPLANERRSYTVHDGVALFSMSGVIGPKANLLMEISGGTSAQLLRNEIMTAAQDPKVKAGILYGDTPGGNVLGIAEGAAAWKAFAEQKPAATFSDGMLASAGYWWGSAASRVYISGPMVNVGSIGVRTEHVDTSMAEAQRGVKRTIIKAGRYKAAGDGPLDPKTLEYKQAQVDYLYSLFVDAVAANLGVDVETVLQDMADGRVFIGQQAIDAGLVHGFTSLEDLLAQMAEDPEAVAPIRTQANAAMPPKRKASAVVSLPPAASAAGAAARAADSPQDEPVPPVDSTTTQQENSMPENLTRESFERDHAALYGQIRSEAMAAGAQQERERIQAVRAQVLPGHEALIEQLAFDGKTTGPEAAVAVLNAERGVVAGAAAAHRSDAPPAAPSGAKGTQAQEEAEAKPKGAVKAVIDRMKVYGALNKRPTTA
ncbi:S49 family peptidase [Piscinibacter defluvii]|uniref:S49 family peptidase n=1 Tax=Piscinibacter defluvii TaxID=1796922 RepID=UPI000FDEB49A|nr:S49 family peptidase [Piscinibacter defluvii]